MIVCIQLHSNDSYRHKTKTLIINKKCFNETFYIPETYAAPNLLILDSDITKQISLFSIAH